MITDEFVPFVEGEAPRELAGLEMSAEWVALEAPAPSKPGGAGRVRRTAQASPATAQGGS
jgi:hypothetical protein